MKTEAIIFNNESLKLEFRLSVVSYQFPEIKDDYDGNWLILKYEVKYREKSFVAEDPSILTVDLLSIYEWFDSISKQNIPRWVCLSFIEPNLEFEVFSNDDGKIRFGIKLSLEAKPQFVIEEFLAGDIENVEDDFVMVFEANYHELVQYRDHFKKVIEQYPVKGTL